MSNNIRLEDIIPYKEKDYKGTAELSIRRAKRDLIVKVLNLCKNKYLAADVLGINQRTLNRNIKQHRIKINVNRIYSCLNANY